MKTFLLILICLLNIPAFSATTYTEFYCRATGTNINAGSTTNATAANTYTSGDWNSGTGVFTKTGGDFSAVTVGMWASIYTNGDTQTTFVGRITAVDDTADTLTLSLDARVGLVTPSTTSGTISCKVGGAWSGPFGTVAFPFGYIYGQSTNAAPGPLPRVNFKNEANYVVTSIIQMAQTNVTFEGYTSVPGDQGRATFDGGASGASYILLSLTNTARAVMLKSLIFSSNGASGSATGVFLAGGGEHFIYNCVVHGMRGHGFESTTVNHFEDCEAYDCDLNNSTGKGGFDVTGSGNTLRNCNAHHNTNANACGIQADGSITVTYAITAFNGADGVRSTADVGLYLDHLTSYGNGNAGLFIAGQAGPYTDPLTIGLRNSCFVSNVNAGIRMNNNTGSRYLNGIIRDIAFGTGTMTNQGGNFLNSDGATQFGTNFYGVTMGYILELPADVKGFVDPITGNFNINRAELKSAGTNAYTQTYSGSTWTGSTTYQDIGSAQHLDSGGSSTVIAYPIFRR